MDRQYVTIVSGLPRSGTSMMMQMLRAGGMKMLTDDARGPDKDNPRGYFEFEKVKNTRADESWVAEARGKAVKMVYRLLYDLPGGVTARVVFMHRRIEEVLTSQMVMLGHLGRDAGARSPEEMAALFASALQAFERWAAQRNRLTLLNVRYADVLADPPAQSRRVCEFLDGDLDTAAMAAAVDPALYRNRS